MEKKIIVGICVECFTVLLRDDEMLPDHPGLYQCSHCGHPSDVIADTK